MKTILVWLLLAVVTLADGPFQTQISVVETEAVTAKAASLEPMADRVAVFLTDPDPVKQLGLVITVKTDAKHIAVRATLVDSTKQIRVAKRQNGDYYLFGQPAKYAITVIESDPEKGLSFSDIEAEITSREPTTPPPPPPPPPPPSPDLEQLRATTKSAAAAINDPQTAAALGQAYLAAAAKMAGQTDLAVCKAIAVAARRESLLARTGPSLRIDWTPFLVAIEPLILAIGTNPQLYALAIKTMGESL